MQIFNKKAHQTKEAVESLETLNFATYLNYLTQSLRHYAAFLLKIGTYWAKNVDLRLPLPHSCKLGKLNIIQKGER